MVKHTQTIHRQKPTNCLSVFDHFEGLALKKQPDGFTMPFSVQEKIQEVFSQIFGLLLKNATSNLGILFTQYTI